jgi:hypothetical protein
MSDRSVWYENLQFEKYGVTARMAKIGIPASANSYLHWMIILFLVMYSGLLIRQSQNCPRLFLWGYVTGKVNGNLPADIEELITRICGKISNISEETFWDVMQSFSACVRQ